MAVLRNVNGTYKVPIDGEVEQLFSDHELFHFEDFDDEINITTEMMPKIVSLFSECLWAYGAPYGNVSTDLMVSETVPLPSFLLNIDGHKLIFLTDIVAYDKLCIIENAVSHWFKICPTVVGDDGLPVWGYHLEYSDNVPHYAEEDEYVRAMRKDSNYKSAVYLSLLSLWYGIQIIHLHPRIKTIFSHPKRVKEYSREGTGKSRKRVVKYIKKHYITEADIEAVVRSDGRGYKRKTQLWYVMGHYRNYKNGSRKFIKGYWKGPKRTITKSLPEDYRTRLLPI